MAQTVRDIVTPRMGGVPNVPRLIKTPGVHLQGKHKCNATCNFDLRRIIDL